jgi:hypothetical protein
VGQKSEGRDLRQVLKVANDNDTYVVSGVVKFNYSRHYDVISVTTFKKMLPTKPD